MDAERFYFVFFSSSSDFLCLGSITINLYAELVIPCDRSAMDLLLLYHVASSRFVICLHSLTLLTEPHTLLLSWYN